MFLLSACLVIVALGWYYLQSTYNYWNKRGVPTTSFRYILGHMGRSLTLSKSTGQIYTEIYNAFKDHNYVGYYGFLQPGVVIRNPEIVKDVLLKNFNSFHDNEFVIDEKVDIIFGKNPFVLKGDRWKTVRNQISPCFSSTKVKAMMPLIIGNTKKLIKYITETPEARNEMGLEAKELASKYTAENIASCAFGLEGKSFENEKAEFREHGRRLVAPSFFNVMKFTALIIMPSLANFFKVKFTPDDVTNFLKSMVEQTIGYRKANNVSRNDFLDYMTDLRSKINDEKQFNLDDIVAHTGGFFMDGYETSSVAISYILYEVAANSDVQEKLRKEIDHTLQKNNGEFTYDAIQEMHYLDCVVKESLRKNVPLLAMVKTCTEEFQLPPIKEDNTGQSAIIEKGMTVVIPVYALHHDPKHYPDPERFDPDRFAEGSNISKILYLPFGEGPRMCLGMKFGLLQTKLAIATVLADFEITVNPKTKEPLEINCTHFLMAPVGGLWLNYQKRH